MSAYFRDMSAIIHWCSNRPWQVFSAFLLIVAVAGLAMTDTEMADQRRFLVITGMIMGAVALALSIALVVHLIGRKIGTTAPFKQVLGAVLPALIVLQLAQLTTHYIEAPGIGPVLLLVVLAVLVKGIQHVNQRGLRQAIGTAVLVVGIVAMFWATITGIRV